VFRNFQRKVDKPKMGAASRRLRLFKKSNELKKMFLGLPSGCVCYNLRILKDHKNKVLEVKYGFKRHRRCHHSDKRYRKPGFNTNLDHFGHFILRFFSPLLKPPKTLDSALISCPFEESKDSKSIGMSGLNPKELGFHYSMNVSCCIMRATRPVYFQNHSSED
ncbi:hypothetical protein L9F63_017510, partial [Diploptera punctata]